MNWYCHQSHVMTNSIHSIQQCASNQLIYIHNMTQQCHYPLNNIHLKIIKNRFSALKNSSKCWIQMQCTLCTEELTVCMYISFRLTLPANLLNVTLNTFTQLTETNLHLIWIIHSCVQNAFEWWTYVFHQHIIDMIGQKWWGGRHGDLEGANHLYVS